MNRRDILKSTAAFAAIPFSVFKDSDYSFLEKVIMDTQTFEKQTKIPRFGDGRDWFFQKRYGLFIHWGLYSIPGWHEQHQYRGKVERNEYKELCKQWNPKKFNPDKWLDVMEDAGMKYLCVTTKHIDGFCLWDTKQTDFNTMNTPYKKDIISLLSKACQRRNIPLCLYYAIVDNNHPNYPNQGRAHELPFQPQDEPDIHKYMDFLKAQVHELCSNYGEIHGFWWDANRLGITDPSINAMIRKLQPKAIINDRGFDEGDFGTPERDFHSDDTLFFKKPTEACQSIGIESWGYRKNEDFYSDQHLIRSIDRYLVRNANYLLNVGPMADGTIPNKSVVILKKLGNWYDAVKESLENVTPASTLSTNRDVMLTKRGKALYVHLNKELHGNVVKLKPINVVPEKATLLNDGRNIDFIVRFSPSDHKEQKAYLNFINLPLNEFCNTALVIKLDFNCSIDDLVRPTSPKDGVLDSNNNI